MKKLASLIVVILILCATSACSSETLETGGVLFILSETGFSYIEYGVPRQMLDDRGINVVIASTVVGDITDDVLNKHRSQTLIKNVKVENYDMIILVGGFGMFEFEDDSQLHSLLREANEKGIYIGAICYSPVLLAKANIIDGREVTVYPRRENIEALTEAGGIYCPEPVISGNIFTASGPQDSESFGKTILELLGYSD